MMFKKSWKGGERGRWRPSSPQFPHVYFFSCSRLFNFADPTITKPNRRKKYIRFETDTDTSGRGFYFNWGTKRRIKMTEVQLEKKWLCDRRSNESGNHILRGKKPRLTFKSYMILRDSKASIWKKKKTGNAWDTHTHNHTTKCDQWHISISTYRSQFKHVKEFVRRTEEKIKKIEIN